MPKPDTTHKKGVEKAEAAPTRSISSSLRAAFMESLAENAKGFSSAE